MPRYITNDGKTYYIPTEVVSDFEKDYPDAKVEYSADNRVFHIPLSKREGFLAKYPDAKYTEKETKGKPIVDARKWLYGHLKDNGYEIGTQEEFECSLDNIDDDAEWYHQKALDLGLEVGSYDDFVATFRKSQSDLNTAQEANLTDISVAPLMGISDVVIIALAFIIGAVGSGVFFKVRKKEGRGIKYLIAGVGVVILLVLAYLFALNNRYYVKDAGVYFDKWTKTMYVLDDGNFKPIEKTR